MFEISLCRAASLAPCDTWLDYSICRSLSRASPWCPLMSSALHFSCLLHCLSLVSHPVALADGRLCWRYPHPLFVQGGLAGAVQALRQMCNLEIEQSFPSQGGGRGMCQQCIVLPLALFSPCLSCVSHGFLLCELSCGLT